MTASIGKSSVLILWLALALSACGLKGTESASESAISEEGADDGERSDQGTGRDDAADLGASRGVQPDPIIRPRRDAVSVGLPAFSELVSGAAESASPRFNARIVVGVPRGKAASSNYSATVGVDLRR